VTHTLLWRLFVILVVVYAGRVSTLLGQTPNRLVRTVGQAEGGRDVSNVVDTYCSGCHNGRIRSPSGFLLDRFDAAAIAASPEVWSRAYRQIQAGTIPPVDVPRPDRATLDTVLASIEQALGATEKPPAAASSQEIATRLAAMLWNSAPDATLRLEAQGNRLSDSAALARQIRRMFADDRAQAFVSRFFFPWLQLDELQRRP
jgi:hypothetical protein